MLRFLGYALLGRNVEQKFPLIVGPKRTGKSKALEISVQRSWTGLCDHLAAEADHEIEVGNAPRQRDLEHPWQAARGDL